MHPAIGEKLAESIEQVAASEKGLAALLIVVRQFVKDKGIEALPVEGRAIGRFNERQKDCPFGLNEVN